MTGFQIHKFANDATAAVDQSDVRWNVATVEIVYEHYLHDGDFARGQPTNGDENLRPQRELNVGLCVAQVPKRSARERMPLVAVGAARIVAATLAAILAQEMVNGLVQLLQLFSVDFFGCDVGDFEQRGQNAVLAWGQRPLQPPKKLRD